MTHGKALYIWHTTSPIDTQNKKTKTKVVQGMGEFSEVCRRAVANLVPQLLVVIYGIPELGGRIRESSEMMN